MTDTIGPDNLPPSYLRRRFVKREPIEAVQVRRGGAGPACAKGSLRGN